MKILHIVAGNMNGGAARGAYWLHSGLINHGIDSVILTNSTDTLNDNHVVSIIHNKVDKLINSFRVHLDPFLTSFYKKNFPTHDNALPITEEISSKILTLPLYPNMTNEEINYLINSIDEFFEKL